jgi:hypothetical protein
MTRWSVPPAAEVWCALLPDRPDWADRAPSCANPARPLPCLSPETPFAYPIDRCGMSASEVTPGRLARAATQATRPSIGVSHTARGASAKTVQGRVESCRRNDPNAVGSSERALTADPDTLHFGFDAAPPNTSCNRIAHHHKTSRIGGRNADTRTRHAIPQNAAACSRA